MAVYIKTPNSLPVSSRCQGRDVAYLSRTPIAINRSSISNDLTGLFCIAVAADIVVNNDDPNMTFTSRTFTSSSGVLVGNITLAGSQILVDILYRRTTCSIHPKNIYHWTSIFPAVLQWKHDNPL